MVLRLIMLAEEGTLIDPLGAGYMFAADVYKLDVSVSVPLEPGKNLTLTGFSFEDTVDILLADYSVSLSLSIEPRTAIAIAVGVVSVLGLSGVLPAYELMAVSPITTYEDVFSIISNLSILRIKLYGKLILDIIGGGGGIISLFA